MAIDNTHTKYLKGNDKKAWNGYKEAFEAQNKLENFLGGLMGSSSRIPDMKEGEVIDIPYRPKK